MKKQVKKQTAPFSSAELKQYVNESRGMPQAFNKHINKTKHMMLFVHSYPDLDAAIKGYNVIARPCVVKNMGGTLLVSNATGLKEGSHVFLNAVKHDPTKMVMAYVEAVKGNYAVISGMSSYYA